MMFYFLIEQVKRKKKSIHLKYYIFHIRTSLMFIPPKFCNNRGGFTATPAFTACVPGVCWLQGLCVKVWVWGHLWSHPVWLDTTEHSVTACSKQPESGFCKGAEANPLSLSGIDS